MITDRDCLGSAQAQVIIVGAGGFAEEVIDYLRATSGVCISGIVDDYLRNDVPTHVRGVPFLGSLAAAMAQHPEARFVVAAGKPAFREEVCEALLSQDRQLHTVIHPSALVASDASIGAGCIIAPYAIVNAGADLEIGSVLNVFCSVGHGASVGPYSVLSPYAAINGWAKVGRACFLGTRATVYPRVRVGDRCEIDTHSYAKADVDDRMIVTVRGEYRVLKNRLEKQQ